MRAAHSLGSVLFAALLAACSSPTGPEMRRVPDSTVPIIVPGDATLEGGTSKKPTATAPTS